MSISTTNNLGESISPRYARDAWERVGEFLPYSLKWAIAKTLSGNC
ncbi:MAG: hypothetical protein AB4352_01320 [Hormoscilla sp.]